MKINKIIEFHERRKKQINNHGIPLENYEHHENHRIPLENHENHYNFKTPHENYENNENH